MPTLTWDAVRAQRVARNHLAKPASRARLVQVARDVCGFQAQLLSAAELAISARVAGLTLPELREELWVKRSLVRAWTVRGTIHVVPADDLPLWMAALGKRRYWESKEWLEREGLSVKEALAIFDTVVDALGDRALTRAQVADAVVDRLGSRFRPKISSMWGDLLAPVTYMGKLCFGPSVGANVTFVRANRWVRGWREIDPDEAWRELARRFLHAYGPAPADGMARWFGLETPEALALLRSLDSEVVTVPVEGRPLWRLAADTRAARARRSSVRLLPQYDCYVHGSHPREQVVDPVARERIRSYKRGRFEGAVGVPVLLVDGVVRGVWERTLRKGRIAILVEPAVRLAAAQRREVHAEGERIGRFLGHEVDVSLR
jgi:hypothetical protein